MNFLAHIYLSENDKLLQIGNFIADGIRGKEYLKFPERVSQGIIFHRQIDTFTDNHEIFKNSKKVFQPKYGLYSGIIVDLIYDHFLANNWDKYHTKELEKYISEFYQNLENNFEILPTKTKQFLPIMKQQNWLYSYRTIEGIGKIMQQMDARTKYKSNMSFALEDLTKNYNNLLQDFEFFFVELIKYSKINYPKNFINEI